MTPLTKEQIERVDGCYEHGVEAGILTPVDAETLHQLCLMALQSLTQSTGWRPIAEAPKDGTSILVFNINRDCYINKFCYLFDINAEGGRRWRTSDGEWLPWLNEPTHFMPLPPPPLTQGEGV